MTVAMMSESRDGSAATNPHAKADVAQPKTITGCARFSGRGRGWVVSSFGGRGSGWWSAWVKRRDPPSGHSGKAPVGEVRTHYKGHTSACESSFAGRLEQSAAI